MINVVGFWLVATLLTAIPLYILFSYALRLILSRVKTKMGYSDSYYSSGPYPSALGNFYKFVYGKRWSNDAKSFSWVLLLPAGFVGLGSVMTFTDYIDCVSIASEMCSSVGGWFGVTVGGYLVFDKILNLVAKVMVFSEKVKNK